MPREEHLLEYNRQRNLTAAPAQVALVRDALALLGGKAPPHLAEAGALRVAHQGDTLAALAARAGVTKDVMAGRLRRLIALARELPGQARRPFEPDWTVHPGKFLAELLDLHSMTAAGLAQRTSIAPGAIAAILDGTTAITGDTACALSQVFPDTKQWLAYQAGYDADIARGVTSVLTARGLQHQKSPARCPIQSPDPEGIT